MFSLGPFCGNLLAAVTLKLPESITAAGRRLYNVLMSSLPGKHEIMIFGVLPEDAHRNKGRQNESIIAVTSIDCAGTIGLKNVPVKFHPYAI